MKKLRNTAVIILFAVMLCLTSCDSGNLLEPFGSDDDRFNPADVNTLKEPDIISYTVTRIQYENLSENEKIAYRRIYNEVFSHPSKILIPILTEDEIENVFLALKYDNPHLLCLKNTYTYYKTGTKCYILPEYTHTVEECTARTEEMITAAKEITIKAPMTGDQFGTELYLHDALLEADSYGDGENTDTAYGALVNKVAACGGYTLAAKLLFDIAGIESVVISGKAKNGEGDSIPHLWLSVNVNGDWYFTDPTWDDPVSVTGNESVRHTYFNISEDALKITHSDYTLPCGIECNSEAEDYYTRSGCYCTADGWKSTVQTALLQNAELPVHFEFRFENEAAYDSAKSELFENGEVEQWAEENPDFSSDECKLLYSFDTDRLVIHIYIKSITEA